jgi:hypothetical protein
MQRAAVAALFVGFLVNSILAAPQLKPVKKHPSLVGTAWTGNSFEKQTMTFEFGPGGQVTAMYNGAPVKAASWKQDGDKIWFELNNKYCEFDGKIVGDRIEGQCHNVAGTRWDVVLTKWIRDR